MLWLTGFLGLTQISQIPRYCFVGGKSHRCFCVWAGSRGFHFAFGLTQISQIPQYRFVGGKSHRCFCVWAGSHGFHFAFGLTQISQIPQYCFVGGKSHRCFCVWAGSHGFHFAFGLTRISQIPRFSFVGGKSHRWFCAWAVELHGARSHGFIFWTLRINQTLRTNRTDWTFLKIIREICGICVRRCCHKPRRDMWGRVTKLQKIVLFGGCFERFEKKERKKLIH